jgi:hypothetical protein
MSTLRDLISELDAHFDETNLDEFDPTPTRKLPAGFKPKAKKKFTHHPMHNKTGASTTAPTRKVPAHMLPKSH